MPASSRIDLSKLIGRAPERLTIDERNALAGKWIALEIYTPETLPLRTIEAAGDSAEDCIHQLTARGLEPRTFEFQLLKPAY
jgi:hypothetical protein